MGYECFDVQIEDKIAHIILNRPDQRNAMNHKFWVELPEIVRDIDANSRARVIVISSRGPHFCSGLDLGMFEKIGASRSKAEPSAKEKRDARVTAGEVKYDDILRLQQSLSTLEDARIPVLVAIQGGAIGGGVDLATACDIRYATEDAFLCIQEVNIGMTADVGTFPRLVKLIPEGIVRELAYTGRRMPASEAQAVGLVNKVFPDQKSMLEGVMEVAREIASKAPLAVYGSKQMINYARDHTTRDGLDYVSIWNASFLQSEEVNEAISARAEKRDADFAELPRLTRGPTS